MPRRGRLDAPGTLHHVMIREIEGKLIFRDNRDRECGIPLAGIARELEVYISSFARAFQKMETIV